MYNLLEQQWIPVLFDDGRFARVGILEALVQSGRIRQIAASNPMDRVAVLRFLLAILYWCRGNPSGGDLQVRQDEGFPSEWFARLEEQRSCFNLLGDGHRFYQYADAKRPRPATDLLHEIPTGNNFWHFLHTIDGQQGLCHACCALGLLRLPLFSVSGLPDLKSGINGTPPVYILPFAESLAATLRVNWNCHDLLGRPAWEEPFVAKPEVERIPLLAGLTMLSRRVRLHEPSPATSACIACGRIQDALILTCEYQTAGEPPKRGWEDPHVIYVEKPNPGKDPIRKPSVAPDPLKASFRLDKPWTTLVAQTAATRTKPTRVLMVGFATDKAKHIDVWERTCVITRVPDDQEGAAMVERFATWHAQGDKLPLRIKEGERKSSQAETAALRAIRPHVESCVSNHVSDLLSKPDDAWPRAAQEYQELLVAVSRSIAPGSTTQTILRRRRIARALPDVRPVAADKPAVSKKRKGVSS